MPPKEITDLVIPYEQLYEKLALKGITVEEVQQAVMNADRVFVGPRDSFPRPGKCYFVRSETDAGRRLRVLVRRFPGGTARLITAWEDS